MPSKSQKQHDLMVRACKSKAFAEQVGISQEVACEFVEADLKAGKWIESDDTIALHDYLASLQDKVRKELTIVTPEDLGQNFLLHITAEKNPVYVPRIGFRQADTEDRTVPRITASPFLLGCILGYAVLLSNFLYNEVYGITHKDVAWKNGLYIQKLPFKRALRPSRKLCYDVAASHEHWLVNYSKATQEYVSDRVGKFFINQVTLIPFQGRPPQQRYELFLHLTEGIPFAEKLWLDPGYYCLSFLLDHTTTYKAYSAVEATAITQAAFMERKKVVASLLSAEPSFFAKW